MGTLLAGLAFGLLGYLSGSLSFALWVTKLVKGVDVREAGSRHATTTNTIRQAGWLPGIAVFILDIAKGFVPAFLALRFSPMEWAVPLAGVMAVIGHCWPLFAGFRGGMGLATFGGALLVVFPLGFAVGLGLLITLALLMRHSARASFLTGLLLAPIFWLLEQSGTVLWLAAGAGLVIAIRFLSDWNRKYRELWLDREKHAYEDVPSSGDS